MTELLITVRATKVITKYIHGCRDKNAKSGFILERVLFVQGIGIRSQETDGLFQSDIARVGMDFENHIRISGV